MRLIKQCINEQLNKICQKSLQIEELSIKVSQLIPEELAAHCRVGGISNNCLLLTTTDANWATQLRYALPELRDRLRKEAQMYLSSIKITIVPPPPSYNTPTKKAPAANALSDKAKNTILSESEHCAYQPLKKAWLNLSR